MLIETPQKSFLSIIKKPFMIYAGLPKSIYVLFIVTVVNGLGMFVFPFMTLLLTKKIGLDTQAAGNFLFLMSLAYTPGAILGGKLADHFGRKKVMMITQAISVAFLIPCGFLGNSWWIMVFIMGSLLFDGITDPSRSAMNTDLTNPENRQAAFSLLYLGHNLGFAGGPLIAGFLFYNAPEWMFWGNAIAAGLALILVLVFVPETKPTKEQIAESLKSDSTEKAHKGNLFQALLSRPFLIFYILIATWYGFVYSQHRFILPLQTEALLDKDGAPLYGLLMTLNAVIVVVLNAPIVALLKKFTPIINSAIAGFLFAFGFGILSLANFIPNIGLFVFFMFSTLLWTLGEIVDATNSNVYIANHTPMSHRARFNAILPLIGGIGWLLSTPVSGYLLKVIGIQFTWAIMALIAFAAAFGMILLNKAELKAKAKGKITEENLEEVE